MHVAILVPAPDFGEPWHWAFDAEAAALVSAGIETVPVAWTETDDLTGYDLILPLVAWGYHLRYADWLAFLDRAQNGGWPVVNPPELLRWNSDKTYLHELNEAGIPSVPTTISDSLDEDALAAARSHFGVDELVIKPLVSASAHGTHRLPAGSPLPDGARGKRMMIQPWLTRISDVGEYSLILFDGVLSHAVSKIPKAGDFRVQPEYGSSIVDCAAPEGGAEIARAALAAAPAAAAYARVDLVVGNDGGLQIIELELIEPALFLDHKPSAGAAFARAVRRAAANLEARSPNRRAS